MYNGEAVICVIPKDYNKKCMLPSLQRQTSVIHGLTLGLPNWSIDPFAIFY